MRSWSKPLTPNWREPYLCLQIWGSTQHKGVQAPATLDEKLEQTLFAKPYCLNPKHFLLCVQIWGSVQHKGVQARQP